MLSSAQHGALSFAAAQALRFLEELPAKPVAATASLADLRARLGKQLSDDPMDPQRVIAELIADAEGGLLGSAGPRFFAWAVGGSLPAALAADWLTAAWDQNGALYACAPAAAVVEEVVGEWLKDLLGLPSEASFALVTGCQMAHVTCLAAARHELLSRRGWDVERSGLCGAPRIRIVTSNRHGSVARAVRLLGLGEDSVIDLALDEREMARPEDLERQLAQLTGEPAIVILQAGDLNTGAFDDYTQLIPVARRHGAWVHIDGAFGLWAAASPHYRHLLAGAAQADSWATDGHKWLNVPYDCGYAFVRRRHSHRAAMSHRASYLVHDQDARDQLDWNPDWSRRARGFATYAALRELGRKGLASLIEECCRHARDLTAGIGALPGAEILWEPTLNQGLVKFPDTDLVIQKLLADGRAYFSGTTWHGQRAMRISVLNWQTTSEDVAITVDAVRRCLDASR